MNSVGAQQFTTGSAAVLTSVDVYLGDNGRWGVEDIRVRILQDDSGSPGTELVTLPYLTAKIDHAINTFTAPADTNLAAGTTYFVEVSKNGDVGVNYWRTSSHLEEDGGATDWEIGDTRYFKSTASQASWSTSSLVMMIAIKGTAAGDTPTPSTDATLSDLVVNDGSSDLTLTPTFASGTETYAATVANSVDEVTVTPTTTDTNATVAYLNASDATLDDADTVKDDFQVALAVGDTVFKVQVTAEDTTTTQTYTVTVTRAAAGTTTVTIAADQPAFTATLDNVTFTLTRTGDAAAALDVAVALTQDQDLLESATLPQTVSFGAGDATATLRLVVGHFEGHTVTRESTLTATVQTGAGYAPGSPNTASTRIVVTNPAVTAWIEETAYTFAEDATVDVALRTAPGVPSPNANIDVALSTQAGQAAGGVDYTIFSRTLRIRPSDFTSDGAAFTARQEVTLAIVDDLFDEPDETLTLELERLATTPQSLALRQADGTACQTSERCDVTVTITDNDDPAPQTAGPPPTDDFYLWTTAITVGKSSTGTLGYDASGGYGELSTGADFFYPSFAPPPKHHFDPGSALTVTSLRRFADSNGDEQLRLKLAGLGDTGNVTLWIGNKRFPVTVDNYTSTGTEYHWPSTALNPPTDDPADLVEWEEDDRVRVTLVYERARPSAPTYLTVKAPPGEDGTLEVRWEAPDTEGTFPTTHYLVEFLPVGDPRRVERSYVPVETTSVTRTDLQTGAEYRVLVQALSGDGYGSEATRTITTNGVPASCAPNPGDLWCGVVTVGSGGDIDGYDRGTGDDIGDLSDTDFDVPGSNTYTIVAILVDGITGATPGALTLVLHSNTRLSAADRDTLVLQVGGRSDSFAFSDAAVAAGRDVRWRSAGLDWSEEEYVIVRLRQKTASAGAEESGAPLTAAFAGLPEAHDGETAFTFRIAFSEAVSVTPEAMRTRVLTVTGGAVTGAARVDGESGVWAITVTPDTREALSISLPPAADCEADGAVCTADGRALFIGAAHLVSGPPDDARESNTEATGTPTISGTPQVGETLTADTSGIADDDGLENVSFSYQWLADDTAIQGATKSTYTLIEADERKTVRVRVSFTDDTVEPETPYTYRIKAINEHGESERSRWFHIDTPAAPTPEPTPESPAEPPASPTGLAADVSHDSVTLTWDDPGDDSITGYVILRRDSAIHEEGTFGTVESDTGSAETAYTDDSAQPERKYVYRIKAINEHGESERSRWFHIDTPAAPDSAGSPPN